MSLELVMARVDAIVDEHRRGLAANKGLFDLGALSVELARCQRADVAALRGAHSKLKGIWDEGAALIGAAISQLLQKFADDEADERAADIALRSRRPFNRPDPRMMHRRTDGRLRVGEAVVSKDRPVHRRVRPATTVGASASKASSCRRARLANSNRTASASAPKGWGQHKCSITASGHSRGYLRRRFDRSWSAARSYGVGPLHHACAAAWWS